MIPTNYEQWRHCIEIECGIALEPDYVAQRLTVLTQPGDEPERFARLYGQAHLQHVIGWFQLAQAEVLAGSAS
jgi:hypothetical protein